MLNHIQGTVGKQGKLRGEEIVLPRKKHTNCLSNVNGSSLKIYIGNNIIQSEQANTNGGSYDDFILRCFWNPNCL